MAFILIRIQNSERLTAESMVPVETNLVKKTVRDFINSAVTIDDLSDDENLFESGIVNSLFAVQLMTFVEGRFGIEIGMDDLEVENFKSVSATAAFIERKAGRKAE